MNENIALHNAIQQIKNILSRIDRDSSAIGGWLPKKAVMRFFDYGDSQMKTLEDKKILVVSKIGRRKFYSVESIISLIEKNMQ
jgi:hypothetical protein